MQKQLSIFREMGFGGFFMHSRTGLETEYLGEDWFRMIRLCTENAGGMQPWFYDEDRWPSGSAGGKVTQDPRLRRKYLSLEFDAEGENTLALFAARVEGLAVFDWRWIGGADELRPGETLLAFRMHAMESQSVYNGFTDSDRLSFAATQRFLDVTHRQYKAQCGGAFDHLTGVFTDEPHRGLVFSDFSDPGERRNWSLPWTDDLPEAFEERFGCDLISQLPALFLQPEGSSVARVKWQFMELLQQLFIERYLHPMNQWAKENNKRTTGHFLHEDSLMAQAVPCGSVMRCYPHLDESGIDSLTEIRYTPWAVKALESVCRQLNKPWKLSELFGATGWQMSFQDYKYICDWQTILGINVRCPHLSWYTMAGEAKRDYPGTFSRQATWYREYAGLEDYFTRLGWVISQGTPMCDTLVLHPIESLWARIHPLWANGLDAADSAIQRMERRFTQLFDWLMAAQLDFDYGDEGLLAEHAHAENGRLRVGAMQYRRVLVCGCESIRESTLDLLRAFQLQGGEVLFIGSLPQYVAGERTNVCRELAQQRIPMRKAALLTKLRSERALIAIDDAQAADDFYCQLRRTADGFFAVLWNKSRKRTYSSLSIRVESGFTVQQWDCFTGTCHGLKIENGCIHLDFAPGQEAVLYLSGEEALPTKHFPRRKAVSLGQPTDYALDEENIYVLDRARLWLDEKLLSTHDEILNLDRCLREALHLPRRGGDMVQPWARKVKGGQRHRIRLQYRIHAEHCPKDPVRLALEMLPDMNLTFNGQRVSLERAGEWIDRCFHVCRLPDAWRTGENLLELTAAYDENCGLEAMYLLGDFGVWFRNGEPTIGHLPQKLRVGDITKQGLPFYSGKVRYTFDLPTERPFHLRLSKIGGSCAVASCGETHLIPWPWETPHFPGGQELEIQVVLNRRNTFGPLHRFPVKQPFIAPDSFTCDDPDAYALYPMGLLRAPELLW